MNKVKIRRFLMIFNKGKFLKHQAEQYSLTDADIDYMCKERYIAHIKDDEYRVLPKGSEFAFSKD